MNPTIALILAERGAIAAREYPQLKSTLHRLQHAGDLDSPLPGVFISPQAVDPVSWLRAVSLWSGPLGVIHTSSAAALWGLRDLGLIAHLAHPSLRARRNVVVTRRKIAPEHVVCRSGVRLVTAAYAAAELAAIDDGRAACEALRLRLASYPDLAEAASALAGSRGHQRCHEVVAALENDPWSYAELRLHRILREAGIDDWIGNRPLKINGNLFQPDVRFRRRRLIIEMDGRSTHQAPGQFVLDRERQNQFAMVGYSVLRFTWEHLDQPEYIAHVVRTTLRHAEA